MPDASPSSAYDILQSRFRRIALLGEAEAVLHWDYAAVMPDGRVCRPAASLCSRSINAAFDCP